MASRQQANDLSPRSSSADRLWTAAEYAVWRGCTVQAAAHERCRGSGPPYMKVGKRVYYDPFVVRTWFSARQVYSTAELAA